MAKIDMMADAGRGIAATLPMPDGVVCGEVSFVPRDAGALLAGTAAHDDGFLVGYTTHAQSGKSFCNVRCRLTVSTGAALLTQSRRFCVLVAMSGHRV